jgi:acetyl esterase/lipase
MGAEVSVRSDVVFGTGGGIDLQCDVYSPGGLDPAVPAPAVVLLHGGAWKMGSRGVMEGFGRRLAAAGFVGVASQYRLLPDSSWPAHIHDAKAAIRWTRASAGELGVDPDRIAVLGRSAGGHLALLAAGTPDRPELEGDGGNAGVSSAVAAAVGIFPPTTFSVGERTRGATPATALLGDAPDEAAAALASPLAQVTPAYPPTFLLHGTADRVVPPSASMVMYEALVAAGVPVELHLYAEEPHGFAGRPDYLDLCAAEIAHFLHRRMPARELAVEGAVTASK